VLGQDSQDNKLPHYMTRLPSIMFETRQYPDSFVCSAQSLVSPRLASRHPSVVQTQTPNFQSIKAETHCCHHQPNPNRHVPGGICQLCTLACLETWQSRAFLVSSMHTFIRLSSEQHSRNTAGLIANCFSPQPPLGFLTCNLNLHLIYQRCDLLQVRESACSVFDVKCL